MFDSGVGGLTVLGALMSALPHERFVYLGDTARVPYGSKPLDMVTGFADEIAAELTERDVKAIVIACNTASAACLPALAQNSAVPVWGVVEPGVSAALSAMSDGGVVGVLGTASTVAARVYQDRLEAAGVTTWSRACPMFVPLVEEGLHDSEIARLVVDHYLDDRPELAAVILGCTHYPLLKPVLRETLGAEVPLIDSSEAVASFVAGQLSSLGLLTADATGRAAAPEPASATAGASTTATTTTTATATGSDERLEYLVTGDVDVFLHTAVKLGGPLATASHVDLRRPLPARVAVQGATLPPAPDPAPTTASSVSRSQLPVLAAATTGAA